MFTKILCVFYKIDYINSVRVSKINCLLRIITYTVPTYIAEMWSETFIE